MPYIELLTRYGRSLLENWIVAVGAVGTLVALVLASRWRGRRSDGRLDEDGWSRWASRALLASTVALGLVWAWHLRWLCDDAYISFRYADSLARGDGLVFNPGERVEGYTNFLWTVIIAAAIKVGADPGQAAIVLGLGCYVASIVLLARLGARLGRGRLLLLGLAPLLVAANYAVASFATSGLETIFAATLVVSALYAAETRRPALAGLAAVSAAMAHPDHAIFYAALGAALVTTRRWRDVLRYAAPFVALYVPYFLWRYTYYGDLFPNTFYAKSADQAYFRQGWIYVVVSALGVGAWGALPLAAVGAFRRLETITARFALVALPLFLVYVAKVGGDFMLGRLLVPAFAVLFLLADLGLRDLLARDKPALAIALAAPACLAAVPTSVVAPGEKKWHIADERTFYPLQSFSPVFVLSPYMHQGQSLARVFPPGGPQPKIAVACVGIVGYLSRLPLFDLYGLTSRSVAHMPILRRGRPGHEKYGSAGHVLAADVVLSEIPVVPEPFADLTKVELDGFRYFLARYEPGVIASLKAGGGAVTSLPDYLDGLGASWPRSTPDEVGCRLGFLEDYYFRHTDDPARRARMVDEAVAADSSLAGVRELLLRKEGPAALGYAPIRRTSFDDGFESGFASSGTAFATGSQDRAVPGQAEVFGHEGRFLSSFGRAGGDGLKGALRSQPMRLEGDVMTLLVGGGRDLARVRVALLVDGAPVRVATGCETETLSRRVWNIAPFKGATAQLEILDDSDGGWGHLLVDEIVEWKAPVRAEPRDARALPRSP